MTKELKNLYHSFHIINLEEGIIFDKKCCALEKNTGTNNIYPVLAIEKLILETTFIFAFMYQI